MDFDEILIATRESTFYWLLFSIFLSMVWVVYLTFYNSRVVGLIITVVLNRFVPYGHIKFGSFSISVISGKIMFRNFHWITESFSFRVKLGCIIFRWWWPLVNKNFDEDLSRSDTRLSLYLEKFEYHIYNHSSNFSKLEELFGLDNIIDPTYVSPEAESSKRKTSKVELNKSKWAWRNLLPVIKLDISDAKVIFGNYLMPQSLLLSSRDLHIVYTTKPASTPFDLFMHIIKGKADNFKVMLVPSPKYAGKAEMPPRCMGEGFAVLQSNQVEFYYYQDEAGLVPYEPESVYLANGDMVSIRTWPCWGMDLKCGKNTDISYGPWCERQKEFLYNFFYPMDYVPMKAQELPAPGQMRVFRSFDFKLSFQHNTNIDILFTKSTETQALHMVCKPGSYMEYTLPMFLDEDGYTFVLTGQLMRLETSTSLKYRNFVECETLEFVVKNIYPSNWNDQQDYIYDLTACRVTAYIIYQLKDFFTDLIDDWSSKERPDLLTFVPYTMHLNLIVKEFEVILLCNQWNWVDCFGTAAENCQMGVKGETFDMSLKLPYNEYLPKTVLVNFFLRLESLEGLLYLPETNTSRHLLISLSKNMKVFTREGNVVTVDNADNSKKWRRVCSYSEGWITVITTPIVAFSLEYDYHPIPLLYTSKELGSFNTEEVDTEDKMMNAFKLIPLRPMRTKTNNKGKSNASVYSNFDPSGMDPDVFLIECEIGPTVVYAYGTLVSMFLEFKENYLGDFQNISDFEKNIEATTATARKSSTGTEESYTIDEGDFRLYRPFSVIFHLTLHDIQGHLVKNCTKDGPPCPTFFLERVVFEMDKKYHETILQVNLSSIMVVCMDTYQRQMQQRHMNRGFLTLSSLQVRGHAMFSHEGLPLKAETLEYAWLIEVVVGDLVGRLTMAQLQNTAEALKTFVFLVTDNENKLVCPNAFELCQHMVDQNDCIKSGNNFLSSCPTVADLKYEFVRVSVDCIDLHLVESGSSLNLQIYPVRLSRCNLISASTKENVSLLLPKLTLKHYVSFKSEDLKVTEDTWLEVGGFNLGPIFIDLSKNLDLPFLLASQYDFLRLHDKRTKRLHFLWDSAKCGCVGGCNFFGNNRNGEPFFHPSSKDKEKNTNVAIPHIFENPKDGFGFQQSILKPKKNVFSQTPLTAAEYLNKIIKTAWNFTPGRTRKSLSDSLNTVFSKNTQEGKKNKIDWTYKKRSLAKLKKQLSANEHEEEEEEEGDNSSVDSIPNPFVAESDSSFEQGENDLKKNITSIKIDKETSGSYPILQKNLSKNDRNHHSIEIPSLFKAFEVKHSKDIREKLKEGVNAIKNSVGSNDIMRDSKTTLYKHAWDNADRMSTDSKDSFKSALSFPYDNLEEKNTEPSDIKSSPTNSEKRKSSKRSQKSLSNVLVRKKSSMKDLKKSKQPPKKVHVTQTVPNKQREKDFNSLINCYSCYMSKNHCHNWSSPLPVFSSKPNADPIESSNKLTKDNLIYRVPQFVTISRGLDCHSIISNHFAENFSDYNKTEEISIFKKHVNERFGSVSFSIASSNKVEEPRDDKKVDNWVAVLQLQKSLDVMLSPLMLDALNRYIDSLIPTLETMHPSSIVDLLHMDCLTTLSRREDKNTTLTTCFDAFSETAEATKTIEKYKCDNLRIKINLPQINVSFLQVCSVNDVKNKDVKDFSSVSLLSLSFNNTILNLFHNTEIKTSSTILMSNTKDIKNKKNTEASFFDGNLTMLNISHRLGVGRKKMADLRKRLKNTNTCIVKCKTFSESRKTDMVLQVKLSQLHVQLRRSKNLVSNDADLFTYTSIPSTSSKVFFKFKDADEMLEENPKVPYSWNLYKKELSANSKVAVQPESINQVIGLIMFECGLEAISFEMAQQFGYSENSNKNMLREKEKTLKLNLSKSSSSPELNYDTPDSSPQHLETDVLRMSSSNFKQRPFARSPNTKKIDKGTSLASILSKTDECPKKLAGDATSVALEIKAVWFNFASPSSIKDLKNINERQNWNLLSTASPFILAWMEPSSTTAAIANHAKEKFLRRQYLVMASLMTDALEVQAIHLMTKSKYNKTSWESKYLQDEPSSQLLTVLRRYINNLGVTTIENCFLHPNLPDNETLKKGILVLTRQWKNVLYLPMLDENTFRSKKKVKVAYAVPLVQNRYYNVSPRGSASAMMNESINATNDSFTDVFDVTDETTLLLKAEEGASLTARHFSADQPVINTGTIDQKPSPIDLVRIDTMGKFSFQNYESGRECSFSGDSDQALIGKNNKSSNNLTQNLRSNNHLSTKSQYTQSLNVTQNEDMKAHSNSCKTSNVYELAEEVIFDIANSSYINNSNLNFDSNHVTNANNKQETQKTQNNNESSENAPQNWKSKNLSALDDWMKKQQESLVTNNSNQKKTHFDRNLSKDLIYEKKKNTEHKTAKQTILTSTSLQLIDSHVLFKPLLDSVGLDLHPVKMSTIMKKFGGELSASAFLKELRVEIAESESNPKLMKRKSQVKSSLLLPKAKTSLLCKSFKVTLSMIDVLNYVESPKDEPETSERMKIKSVSLNPDMLEQFENKPVTTKVNFEVLSQSVTQHVNMSLLRLVHQFVTMVQLLTTSHNKPGSPFFQMDLVKNTPLYLSDESSNVFNKVFNKSSDAFENRLKRHSHMFYSHPTLNYEGSSKPLNEIYSRSHPRVNKVTIKESLLLLKNTKSSFKKMKSILVSPKKTEKSPSSKCWNNIYHLLNLYSNMIDINKPFHRPVVSMIEDGGKKSFKNRRLFNPLTQNLTAETTYPIILFGSVHLKQISISAVLSGLKLQANLKEGHAGFTHKEKITGFIKKKSSTSTVSLSIDNTNVTLYEGVQSSSQQTVVSIELTRSNILLSYFLKPSSENSFCLINLGSISIRIPQHPVALHTMVVHSSKRLSTTLQEFLRTANKRDSEPGSQGPPFFSDVIKTPESSRPMMNTQTKEPSQNSFSHPLNNNANTPLDTNSLPKEMAKKSPKLIELHFRGRLKGFSIEASLLPSLKAMYQMLDVTSSGVIGSKSRFVIELHKHSLSFSSQINVTSLLPSSATIDLPHIIVKGEYRLFQEQVVGMKTQQKSHYLHSQVHQLYIPHEESSRLVLREGDYLKATADVGAFVHVLTTDLLNHLVFIQKVFMKEINEVVQKVSGGDQPVQIWGDNNLFQTSPSKKAFLYSFLFKMKGLQITATTPTNNAVRFETGEIEFEVSNRVQKALKTENILTKENNLDHNTNYVFSAEDLDAPPKTFFQIKVNLNLALGTLIKHPIFEEAEPEFPHLASFSTSILLRNALQDEMIAGVTMDQEAVLINLERPIIFVLPSAFDKAILVWLNYRNAYEYWTEQRMGLNSEIKVATKQVFTKLPPIAENSLSVLFLQITINDLGICLPMIPYSQGFSSGAKEDVGCGALVVTLEKTQISACSSKCFVCKGRFTDFCLRFADDFHLTYDDWKPEKVNEFVMNALVVPNGTFELCSRTDNRKESMLPRHVSAVGIVNAKWVLNILWKMKGIDIHLDTSIGKKLNMAWNTLTSLAGDVALNDETQFNHVEEFKKLDQPSRKTSLMYDELPDFLYDMNLDPKTRTRLIEKEMNEQAKVVQDLKALGASKSTIEEEENKLMSFQKALFHDFRKDILKKFKNPANRGTESILREKTHLRSASDAEMRLVSQKLDSTRSYSQTKYESALQGGTDMQGKFDSVAVSKFTMPVDSSNSSVSQQMFPEHSEEEVEKTSLVNAGSDVVKNRKTNTKVKASMSEAVSEVEHETFAEVTSSSSEDIITIEKTEFRSSSPYANQQQIVEPAIDFELDVKAVIESGKCVLHPKEVKQDQDQDVLNKTRQRTMGSPKSFDKKKAQTKRDPFANLRFTAQHNTVFFIPGVEVKLHYNSKTLPLVEKFNTPFAAEKFKRFTGAKKANLYAWLSIQKLPEEMLISTSILDFLEQAIEPIESFKKLYTSGDQDLNESQDEGLLSTKEQASFPVEVVVSVQVQPSVIRLTCLPVSRVECLFQLPSLDVIFSTRKIDRQDANLLNTPGIGGLCVSVCMTNISLYIFHPYGGGQRKTSNHALKNSLDANTHLSDMENRKDSLSLNIEYLKLNIARSRKVINKQLNFSFSRVDKNLLNVSNNVKFSLICNIGSACFKYDMRKLQEILALPKAWYRRSLARRLFLGEEMTLRGSQFNLADDDDLDSFMSISSSESSDNIAVDVKQSQRSSMYRKFSKKEKKRKSTVAPKSLSPVKVSKTSNPWQTLVLFSINLPQLDVMINMSNAMGNTVWTTKGLQYHSKMMIDSKGFKNANMFMSLNNSKFESKGGIIGGLIELEDVHSQILVKEDPGREPEHKISVSLHTLEIRLDYMGSTFFIGRLSDLMFQFKDEWKFKVEKQLKPEESKGDEVSLMMFIHGKLALDRFHLMISKSTTPDFLKMVHKLEEFFTQQLTSGKRAFSNFSTLTNRSKHKKDETPVDVAPADLMFYRHWQPVFGELTCCKLALFPFTLPNIKAIVGGSINIVGKNITLACFHGVNFRSRYWALFTMDEPNIMFETEAINRSEESKKAVHIVQSLTFQLRGDDNDMSRKNKMATVYKLSRGYYMPPVFTTVQDWFNYAFATSDIRGLETFPKNSPMSSPIVAEGNKRTLRKTVYKHETETIFILPSFRMDLKTFHTQDDKTPDEANKPLVECSFVTDFDDHIFVAMDVEAVLFLHDVITDYIKEKDKVSEKSKMFETDKTKSAESTTKVSDLREFHCKTWHLEPTVRLLSWGGKEIDPVGVDYILQKLGFQHARMTIPKWMQRGCMDPIDKILSLLAHRLIVSLQDEK